MDKFFISHVASCNKCYLQLIPHCQVTFRSATLLTGTHIMQESLHFLHQSKLCKAMDTPRGIRINLTSRLEDLDYADDICRLSHTLSDMKTQTAKPGG
jgi:hypothetical protein